VAVHRVSRPLYFVVFGLLLVLTSAMVWAARLDLGPWNAVVNVTIATTEAFLIALIFMRLRQSSGLIWLIAGGALLWLVLLLSTIGDYLTRNLLEPPPSF
jgi:caa(3)-type oxidase subunit IV